MKSLVYANTINSRQELWEQIQKSANFIMRLSNVFVDVRKPIIKRTRKLIEIDEGHFENLL